MVSSGTTQQDSVKATALAQVRTLSEQIMVLGIRNLAGIFSIGSLPGGYFRPDQSDLDVVVLLYGLPPVTVSQKQRHVNLQRRFQLLADSLHPYEMETLLRYTAELERDPSGFLPNADLAARLISQSIQLGGEFSVNQITTPTRKDFQGETERYLDYWDAKTKLPEFDRTSARLSINHALTLMRLYLAVCAGVLEYDKTYLPECYASNKPLIPLPSALAEAIHKYLQGDSLSAQELDRVWNELESFQTSIIAVIRSANPESRSLLNR